jgi:hypothetical protein
VDPFGCIGVSNKVLVVDSRSAKRSDVPGDVNNKTRVQSWGRARDRSPPVATRVVKSGRFAEAW